MNLHKMILPLALGACLLLSGCGEQKAAEFEPVAAAAALQKSEAFDQALEEMDQETAVLYYGLDGETVKACAVYGSLSAGAEEIAVLVLTDEQAATAAKQQLQTHLEDQREALKDYQPEEVAKVDGAILEQRGTSVLLAVAGDAEKASTVVEGLGKK